MKKGLTRMSFKAKMLITGMLVLLIGVVGVAKFSQPSAISANEEQKSSNSIVADVIENQLLTNGTNLYNEENITTAQMEAYMEGTGYQATAGNTTGKITGSMTNEQYQIAYAALNKQQNDAWNAKYNFNPEINVVHVSTWDDFKGAFENNAVSKIVLEADIHYTVSGNTTNGVRLNRTESIELDGQGYLLEMQNSSLNVDGLRSLSEFGGAFSDVPVFHMHDLQIANNRSYGRLDTDSLTHAWSFVNGYNQWGSSGSTTSSTRGLWRYRIGNIYTPYDKSLTRDNQRVGGRLINATRAEVSVWGYNTVVTGAENFYTGGMTYEPYTFYKGTNAHYDYSVIWFMDNTGNPQDTGTRKFDIGEGSFVYLNYTANGTSYPAVYSYFDELRVGSGATYNANMPGAAAYFSINNSQFIAEEGSTVNLLSRGGSTNRPTVQFGGINYTNSNGTNPSTLNASNGKYEFKSGSKVFIVGKNSGGIISYATTGGNSQFILDNPESFDIRNIYSSTTSTNAFLADNSSQRGTNSFVIKNSDISIWNNAADMDGIPTYDYTNVGEFKVTNGIANGTVTSTDSQLASQYTRPSFKRISGMNSTPELIWTPVTDADYSQKATVLLGYTAEGGSEPFDEHGDAKTKPVYADSIRKAYVDFTDTLGNTFTGVSTSDNFVHWNPTTDTERGSVFQTADLDIKGVPYKLDGNSIRYREGVETATTIIDVTPPEPAEVSTGKVTNANKQLIGTGAEANAKITVQINGGALIDGGTVAADGSWSYDLPAYLTTGDKVKIYLQDNAGAAPADLNPIPPATNSAEGNINPSTTALSYRDAVFQPATEYTVVDVLPDNPAITKTVASYRKGTEVNTTQVGDTLLYTITAKNNKAEAFDTVWSDVVVTDTLPAGLNFDSATAEVTVGGTVINESQYNYNLDTRLLTVNVGDLATQESVVVTFKTTVARTAVGQTITNTAKAEGDSPREVEPFEPGPEIPGKEHQKYDRTSIGANNPGGSVYGTLELLSAPATIDFGTVEYSGRSVRVNNPTKTGADLVVQDSRATRESWTLTAKLTTPMTEVGGSGYVLNNALRYVYQGNEIILNSGAQNVMVHTNDSDEYNVSSTWSETGDGFKLAINANDLKSVGDYQGEILWQLSDTPPEDMP